MSTWTFEITDTINRRFRVARGAHEELHGQSDNGTTAPRPVAGSAAEASDGRLRVMITFDDGNTAEYGRSSTAGQLAFVRWV
ncbi:hypothetical protein EXE59_18945 [Nocardioides eburneiflavus]|uniref:Uncharacterized protein n=1 Tax=Nocardioides eburneiflavus TaxID=2518372 RepID=A0A4Z1CMT6_9ACTN|nr:hypothetical protein [Nocardioides eburneiflavus]TGN65799.1 hypothetical protein EXE59_18945 [Nocardioides eburneiflavus]